MKVAELRKISKKDYALCYKNTENGNVSVMPVVCHEINYEEQIISLVTSGTSEMAIKLSLFLSDKLVEDLGNYDIEVSFDSVSFGEFSIDVSIDIFSCEIDDQNKIIYLVDENYHRKD